MDAASTPGRNVVLPPAPTTPGAPEQGGGETSETPGAGAEPAPTTPAPAEDSDEARRPSAATQLVEAADGLDFEPVDNQSLAAALMQEIRALKEELREEVARCIDEKIDAIKAAAPPSVGQGRRSTKQWMDDERFEEFKVHTRTHTHTHTHTHTQPDAKYRSRI